MATRFIDKEFGANSSTAIADDATGRLKVRDLPDAAGFVKDKVDGFFKYNDDGTIRTLVNTDEAQTFTNKTLTSPTITSPTITNPSIQSVTPVNVTTATVVFTAATHGGRVISFNRATGIAATLPAATGSGVTFKIIVGTTFTGAATIKVANTTDVIWGNATLYQDGGASVNGFAATADDDTITVWTTNNATGGLFGESIELVDYATGKWHCNLVSDAADTEATPFSATV